MGKDIITCSQPNCGGTICVAFHPSLNEVSLNNLCQKYMDMLVTSHSTKCPFRSYASRWSKVMQHHCASSGSEDNNKSSSMSSDIIDTDATVGNSLDNSMVDEVSKALLEGNSSSKCNNNFYVPPYLLPLSDEYLRFEDCSTDGSITRDSVHSGAQQICDKLKPMSRGDIQAMIPEEVMNFCNEMHPNVDMDDVLCQKDSTMKVPYLLSTFGWSVCGEAEQTSSEVGVMVKCNICQAKAVCVIKDDGGESSKKRRRIDNQDDPNLQLKVIDSHRAYCPYVSGFAYKAGQQSKLEGWKGVISKLLKFATSK